MQQIDLREDERIDDLQRNGYRIIQSPSHFCFGMDAVLLSAFANIKAGAKVLDLCSGNGVVPILIAARHPDADITGIEIQDIIADMGRRSVIMNELQSRVRIETGDIKDAPMRFGAGTYDVVTVNPPYMNENHGLTNPDDSKALARHEIMCNLDDVIRVSAAVLKSGGHFYMVHRPHRLTEIFDTMRKYKLEPKRLRMVHPYVNSEAKMVLVEGTRSGGTWLQVEPPLIIYEQEGVYTKELRSLYED